MYCSVDLLIKGLDIWVLGSVKKCTSYNLTVTFYSVDKTEDLAPLRGCSEEARGRGSQGIKEFLQQRPGGGNIRRLLLIKEKQTSQVTEFRAFLCLGRCEVWAHCSHPFDVHLSPLGLVFLIPTLLRVHCGGGGRAAAAEGLMVGILFPSRVPSRGSLPVAGM